MKIALYCPNKPLSHPQPSGDLTIARGLFHFLCHTGNDCREIVQFRSRWFWHEPRGWAEAMTKAAEALANTLSFRPAVWVTYHSYYKSPDIIGPLVCRALRIPYFLLQPMYGTKWRKQSGTRTGFYLNRFALKSARSVFLNNKDDFAALARILPRERMTYVSPGIFPEEFQRDEVRGRELRARLGISPETPLILTAGMFRPGAKFESLSFLFRSLSPLCGKFGNLRVLIAGDGQMRPEIERLAAQLLPGKAIFAGAVPRDVMPCYYSAADIFVFPGINESLGMVYLEAQSCGLPVVALNELGAAQVVENGTTGILVTGEDEGKAMGHSIGSLLSDPSFRSRLGAKGRKYIEEKRNLWKNYRVILRELEKSAAMEG